MKPWINFPFLSMEKVFVQNKPHPLPVAFLDKMNSSNNKQKKNLETWVHWLYNLVQQE